MGENEIGSLLRIILAVGVFAILTTVFIGLFYAIIKLSTSIHQSTYEVN